MPGHHDPEWVEGGEVLVNVEHNDHLHMLPCTLYPSFKWYCTPLCWVFYSTTCEAFIRDGLVRRLTSLR